MLEDYPHQVFEAHSTDYQTDRAYRELVDNHFAILKVGPALTFALREALFSLCHIEEEMYGPEQCSGLRQAIETAMLEAPQNWQKYYSGSEDQVRFARRYSFSDRIRYYWPTPAVQAAQQTLFHNLTQRRSLIRCSASICRASSPPCAKANLRCTLRRWSRRTSNRFYPATRRPACVTN